MKAAADTMSEEELIKWEAELERGELWKETFDPVALEEKITCPGCGNRKYHMAKLCHKCTYPKGETHHA